MHYEMMTVTPELADRWLKERNNRNRSISVSKVKSYSADMENGMWQETHQNSIAFYQDGNLADGQHRLAAIVAASKSVEFMVFFGLKDDAAYGIDAHRMRATHDQIKIAGHNDWIGKDAIACARLISPKGFWRHGAPSPQQVESFCEVNKDAIQFALISLPKGSGSAAVRAGIALAYYHEKIDVLEEWCEVMRTGMAFSITDRTVIALREKIMRDPEFRSLGAIQRERLCKLTMRSIHAFCRGEILTKLYEPKDRIYEIPS